MEVFLGRITQHAMNYAIRSGIAITSTYAIKQCSRLLKSLDNTAESQELQNLQERLDSKIRIISPAIDMIELISARGNTSLESAVSLTKALRWDIQSLAIRLAKAASAEEISRHGGGRARTGPFHEAELFHIVQDIKKLLLRIEDAVPLINLAITTSGASLSTTLPATVSPSRLLQASTFLTAGDTQFSIKPDSPVQVGPAFVLSVYMLFAGHAHRARVEEGGIRDTTWKEIVHKARVKLIRVPLFAVYEKCADSMKYSSDPSRSLTTLEESDTTLFGEGKASEFAYQLEIIEDLEDERIHTFEEDEKQPGPYKDVRLAGIRELVPIHEISKIFYADTGKILNIGNDGESNSPVLLLKRDVNALPPRRMMDQSEHGQTYEDLEDTTNECDEDDDSQTDIDHQIHNESSVYVSATHHDHPQPKEERQWCFPPNLDPEWLAFEVYTEADDASSTDDNDAAEAPRSMSSRTVSPDSQGTPDTEAILGLENLNIDNATSSPIPTTDPELSTTISVPTMFSPSTSPFGLIRSSLSLLEMLIRLTALQQFQQASHLSIPDELLTFFLEESSTTGAGGDGEERRRKRHEARQKVGFDPYDESPVKRRGEEYQHQHPSRGGGASGFDSRAGTPHHGSESEEWYRRSRDRSATPQESPEPWLLPTRDRPYQSPLSDIPSSPQTPYVPSRRATRPLDRLQQQQQREGGATKGGGGGSLLRRGLNNTDADSSLGTSPGTPSLLLAGRNAHHDNDHDQAAQGVEK